MKKLLIFVLAPPGWIMFTVGFFVFYMRDAYYAGSETAQGMLDEIVEGDI